VKVGDHHRVPLADRGDLPPGLGLGKSEPVTVQVEQVVIDPPARPGLVVLGYTRTRETIANLHAAADFYVSPCPYETFGLAALEALSCGTPVLSADRGGVAEQVQTSEAGALFPSGDAGGLAEAAVALFRSDLCELGKRGRSFAVREHAWPAVLDRLFRVYRDVIAA
jgi:alpha-1,6-mannosyltransferase